MKTLIAIPCMDHVWTMFMQAFVAMQIEGECEITMSIGSLIYDSRNQIAQKAVMEGFDRVLWLDSDMVFQPDLFKRLAARLDEGYEYVSGLYFKRRVPHEPVVYKAIKAIREENGNITPTAVSYRDYPKGEIFEISGSGFGAVMMTVDAIRRVIENFGLPFSPIIGFGEDLSFCMRLNELGIKRWCDSSIRLGHIGNRPIYEEDFYDPDL